VAEGAVLQGEELAEAEGEAALPLGGDGEDTRADDVEADIFKEGGVAQGADDVGVDAGGLVAAEQLALEGLAVNRHREVGDGGAGREEEEGGLWGRAVVLRKVRPTVVPASWSSIATATSILSRGARGKAAAR
jgi:hypothetical protein